MNQPIWSMFCKGGSCPLLVANMVAGKKDSSIAATKSLPSSSRPYTMGSRNGPMAWLDSPPTIQLYSPTTTDSSLAAAASTVSWIQQLGWQHSGYRPDESGFQIKPIRRIQENASLLPINLFVKRKTHSACKWRSLLLLLLHPTPTLAAKVNKGLFLL